MKHVRVAILASGSGTTAESFIRDCTAHKFPLTITLVITNNPDAYVLARTEKLNAELGLHTESAVINSHTQAAAKPIKKGHQTPEEQAAILSLLEKHKIDIVLLLGYMKLVGPELIAAYGWKPEYTSIYQARMLNTHPGLLPATIGTHGLGTQEFALSNGMKEAGQTLHIASGTYDTGPTIVEHRVRIEPDETAESLFARVQAVEKAHIAADVSAFVLAQQEHETK